MNEVQQQLYNLHPGPIAVSEYTSCAALSQNHHRHHHLEFIHIPKTGGTTIEDRAALNKIAWGACHWIRATEKTRCPGHPRLEGYDQRRQEARYSISFWHTPISDLPVEEQVPFQNATLLFALVRDPYNRILSEWNYLAGIRQQDRGDRIWKLVIGDENIVKGSLDLHSAASMNAFLVQYLQRIRAGLLDL